MSSWLQSALLAKQPLSNLLRDQQQHADFTLNMLLLSHDTEAGSEDGQARGQQPRCTNTTEDALPVQAEHQDTCHGLLAHPLEARQLSLDVLRAQVSQGFGQEAPVA